MKEVKYSWRELVYLKKLSRIGYRQTKKWNTWEKEIKAQVMWNECFPGGSDSKASACSAGDPGSIPGLGRSPGERNGNPLQYCCLENSMDGGTW